MKVDESITPNVESAKYLCLFLSTRSPVTAVNSSVTLLLFLADVSIYCIFNASAKLCNKINKTLIFASYLAMWQQLLLFELLQFIYLNFMV